MAEKNSSKADRPPAEAPMPTMGNGVGAAAGWFLGNVPLVLAVVFFLDLIIALRDALWA